MEATTAIDAVLYRVVAIISALLLLRASTSIIAVILHLHQALLVLFSLSNIVAALIFLACHCISSTIIEFSLGHHTTIVLPLSHCSIIVLAPVIIIALLIMHSLLLQACKACIYL